MKTRQLFLTMIGLTVGWLGCTNANNVERSVDDSSGTYAQTASQGLFESHTALHLTIQAPYRKMFDIAKSNPLSAPQEYYAARVSYDDPQGVRRDMEASVKVRGERTIQSCTFLKLKMKISKEEAARNPMFANAREIKIGTHCREEEGKDKYGKIYGDKAAHREAFLYSLFPILGMTGQASRPAVITYIDTDTNAIVKKEAFLYEDPEVLAKRLGLEEIKDTSGGLGWPLALYERMDQAQVAKVLLFNNFIGNWDSYIEVSYIDDNTVLYKPRFQTKNIELLQKGNDGPVVPIAQDFDLARLVTIPPLWMEARRGGSPVYIGPPSPTPQEIREERKRLLKEGFAPEGIFQIGFAKDWSDISASAEHQAQAFAMFSGKKQTLLNHLATYPMDAEGREYIAQSIELYYEVLAETVGVQ